MMLLIKFLFFCRNFLNEIVVGIKYINGIKDFNRNGDLKELGI